MRILFVARRYWPAVGGVESHLRDLAWGLAERHEVTVLAQQVDESVAGRLGDSLRPPPTFEPFRDGRVSVVPFRVSPLRRLLLVPLLYQVIPVMRRYAYGRSRGAAGALYARVVAPAVAWRMTECDVVHMIGGDLLAAAVARSARSRRKPVVVTPFAHRGQWGDDPASARAYRSADRVVALLDEDAELYRALGVSDEQLSLCGLCTRGVAADGGAELRRSLGISGPLVLFLGVRRPYKGFEILNAAASLVARVRNDVTFAFLGPGPPVQPDGGVRIIDRNLVVLDPERSAWLDAADLLCLPSAGEITPLSILEAWSVGTPALTSDIPNLVELARRSGGAVCTTRTPVAVADAILELMADPERLRRMGEAGHTYWRGHHSLEAVSACHEQIYAGLTAESTS